MNTILESTQGDLTHSSTVMMWILAASAVLFLFGAGPFSISHIVDGLSQHRLRSGIVPAQSATRVSLPASGHHHQQRQP
ncbi:hypothetical protein DFH94DRAFT_694128 [Russula ochroleuca]|uniref:Uncharacterized protein n=1 Tax=Russula ochroleuca TaxID=152965 RepID=A0A9P5MSZ9_9AGAM|nr:hypothetical protein DFH94DRAFT_694128 [Russula ochroleuca]